MDRRVGLFNKIDVNALRRTAALKQQIRSQRVRNDILDEYLDRDMSKILRPVPRTSEDIAEKQQPFLEENYRVGKELQEHKPILQQILSEQESNSAKLNDSLKAIKGPEPRQVSDVVARAIRSRDDDSGLGIKPDTAPGSSPLDFVIGTKKIRISGDTLFIENDEYDATKGLMELLSKKNPQMQLVDDYDTTSYLSIIRDSKAYRQVPGAQSSKPLSSTGIKWKTIVGPWYRENVEKSKRSSPQGSGLQSYTFLSSDPNNLVDRLALLFRSRAAGNTGTFNEIRAILDYLKQKKYIQKRLYQSLLSKSRIE